ncbi:MAG: hypothetical protein ACYTGL_15300 [Planctomycetota bacterium]|jgi:hypothetical protein
MSKTNYFLITLVGALPAGGCLYVLIMNLLDRADSLSTVLLAVTITAAICMVLVVVTPFMVLVGYKDPRPKLAGAAAGGAGAAAVGEAEEAQAGADGFGDVIPDDYDEDELAASTTEDYDEFGTEAYDDGDFDDFDMDDDEYV